MRRRAFVAAIAVLMSTLVAPQAASAAPNLAAVHVKLQPVMTGLDNPVAIAWRGTDSRMYVAEQSGHIVIVSNGHIVKTILDLSVSHGSEQGLLGLAFSSNKLYVDYTNPAGDTRVDEYTMNGDSVLSGTRRNLLAQSQPFDNHNGGQVTIGPDNMLYVALGDGGSGGDPNGNGQNLGTWLGKILRIDPRPSGSRPYGIPATNPLVGQAGRRPEIWMYGLRNPWRWSFDGATRDMWIGDVGQDFYEEVDWAPAGMKGVNWGWNKREGLHSYNGGAKPPGARDPILERAHTLGDCAVIGGYVYHGTAIASLGGAYVFGDLCTGNVRALYQTAGTIHQQRDLGLHVPDLATFARGPRGELYAVSHDGTINKIVPA